MRHKCELLMNLVLTPQTVTCPPHGGGGGGGECITKIVLGGCIRVLALFLLGDYRDV